MFYVRAPKESARKGGWAGCRRDICDALDDARLMGPGSKVESRDGTVLAEIVLYVPSFRLVGVESGFAGGGSTGAALGQRFSIPTFFNVGVRP